MLTCRNTMNNCGPGLGTTMAAGGPPYDTKIAGLYDLLDTLGSGHFAVVKLARHVFTGEKVAVKVIDKSKLDEVSKSHLFQEVKLLILIIYNFLSFCMIPILLH